MAATSAMTREGGAPAPAAPWPVSVASKMRLPWPILLYLFLIVVPIQFHLGPLFFTAARFMLLLMVVPLTINLLAGRYGRLVWTDLLFFLFVVWAALAMLANNPDRVIEHIGAMGVEFIGAYVLARAYIRDAQTFGALCRVLVLLVCLTLPFALLEALSGDRLVLDTVRQLPGITTPNPLTGDSDNRLRWGLYRTQVFAPHPILYGLFCASALAMAFVGLKGLYSNGTRYLLTGLVCLCVFLSLSSGSWFAALFQIFFIGWAWLFRHTAKRWLILVALFAAGYIFIDLLSNRTPVKVFISYATLNPVTGYYRLAQFDWGMVNVWANPLFGIGLNDWVRLPWMSWSVDNFWLLMAMRYGIPGFLLLAVGYHLPLWKIGRRNLDADPFLWQFRRAWMITFMGLTFTLWTVHIWESVYSYVFFLYGAGMWLLTADPEGRVAADSDPSGTPAESRAVGERSRYVHTFGDNRPQLPYSRFSPADSRSGNSALANKKKQAGMKRASKLREKNLTPSQRRDLHKF